MNTLTDAWKESGRSLEKFEEVIRELSERTFVITNVNPDTFYMLNKVCATEQELQFVLASRGEADHKLFRVGTNMVEIRQEAPVKVETLQACGVDAELLAEIDANGTMATIRLNGDRDLYLISGNAIGDLMRMANVGGASFRRYSRIRNEAIMQFLPAKKFGLVCRKANDGGICKIFAVTSAKYAYVDQRVIPDAIRGVKSLGELRLVGWEVDNFLTRAQIELPDLKTEYEKLFNLPAEIRLVPGIEFRTSDTGDSALVAIPIFSLDGRIYLPADTFTRRRHYGRVNSEEFIERVDSDAFEDFKKLPKRMGEICMMGQVPTEKAIQMAFQAMRLDGQYVKPAVLEDLIVKIFEDIGKEQYNLYDIVLEVIYSFQREGLSNGAKEHLMARALKAAFAPFETLKK